MKSKVLALGSVAVASLTVAGCNTIGAAAGLEKKTPDEFNVVTKAPLVVPPEFGLRPPATGAELPAEIDPSGRSRNLLFGEDTGQAASAGERALVAQAGAVAAPGSIRTRVDYEEAEIMRKSSGFAEKVLSFVPLNNTSTDAEGNPLDAEAEAARLREIETVNNATGGEQVIIQRGSSGRKLPGT